MKPVNPNSDNWRNIAENAKEQIEQLRDALERDADEKTTTELRGRIRAYRAVLKWPELGSNEPEEGIKLI